MISTPQTRDMAQRVFDYIHKHEDRFNMRSWFNIISDDNRDRDLNNIVIGENYCNTTMCLAGTAMFLDQGIKGLKKFGITNGVDSVVDAKDEAMHLLGLNLDESRFLFHSNEEEAIQILKHIVVGEDWYENK